MLQSGPITAQSHSVPAARSILVVAGAALGLACGFAGTYFSTIAIFLKPVSASFGWSRTDISAVSAMSMLGLAAGAPLVGIMMDRLGIRLLIGLSVLAFAACLFTFSLLPASLLMFAATSFLIGVLTVATGPNGYLAALPRLFDRRLGLALSCAMIGAGIGAVLAPLATQTLIQSYGWRRGYQVLALVSLIGGGFAWASLPAASGKAAPTAVRAAVLAGATLREALRHRIFWTLASILFVGAAGGLGTAVHIAAMLDDRGMAPKSVGQIAAFVGVGLMCGRFSGGILMDHIFAPFIGLAMYVLGALGIAIVGLGWATDYPVLALGALLVGFALGAEGDFVAFAVRRYFGLRAFSSIYGFLLSAYSLGGLAGPILFGMAYGKYGDYKLIASMAAVGFLLSAAALMTLGRYRYKAADK